MKTLKAIGALLLLAAMVPAAAQERTTMGVQYQYGLPMGGFKNSLIKDGSPRGASIDIQYAINPQWRIGGALGYQDFYQKNPRQTYKMSDGSDISAVVTNSVQSTALMAKGSFLPLGADSSRLQPYITLGVGANMVQYSQLLGEFGSSDDVWIRMAAQGGAGIQYALGAKGQTALTLGAVYNYMPLNQAGIKNINNLAVQAGVRFILRNNGRGGRSNGDVWQQRRPNHYDRGW
ncbi:Outer membrane protein beta-barrel domain-containing protein [Cnuella takakiae]|uniref:Outer membrane protein beta-barrel domain-containing protein n=1 Tax=Cnuella takakiae TaxID=1302690 RepID=A0A1M5EID4_9BACT|nr:outer membrane beta-barrel protein [Cnuella takakiae]OLY91183.1 hypothetical protein BUE76_04175 [Cnuella takakiae]SHF78884.1 Outer membrane protein beta-barrel domain-containing protein [Cnuella takakiae]